MGFEIDDSILGNTPQNWKTPLDKPKSLEADLFFMLCSSFLGDAFSFKLHVQENRIIHHVLPVKGLETSQLAFGSSDELMWHTEDAFHSMRADYLGLMGLRNDDHTPTTIADIRDLNLAEGVRSILFENRFLLSPDDTHGIPDDKKNPALVSVLFGDRNSPYICIDPLYMRGVDQAAQEALDTIKKEITRVMKDIFLSQGDICFIDNYKAVHGRKSFQAKFDGRDRWLRRVYLTRDMRKSRELRKNAEERFIESYV